MTDSRVQFSCKWRDKHTKTSSGPQPGTGACLRMFCLSLRYPSSVYTLARLSARGPAGPAWRLTVA